MCVNEVKLNSEDEVSPDDFFQKKVKRAHKKKFVASCSEGDAGGAEEEECEYGDDIVDAGEEDGSHDSIHQIIAKDETCGYEGSDDNAANTASMDAQRFAVEARQALCKRRRLILKF